MAPFSDDEPAPLGDKQADQGRGPPHSSELRQAAGVAAAGRIARQSADRRDSLPDLLHTVKVSNRAEDARNVAAEILDPISKRMMLNIAESYESLAQRVTEQLQSQKSK